MSKLLLLLALLFISCSKQHETRTLSQCKYPTQILNVATTDGDPKIWVIYFDDYDSAERARRAALKIY